jgi:titin
LALWAVLSVLCCSAATMVVSNTSASGPGSLQQAILDANATSGLDTIVFQISGSGVRTIILTNALPAITDPVVIDGTTQPGFTGTPLIELSGVNAGTSSDGLRLPAGSSTIRGLIINRFYGAGIHLQAPGGTNRIEGNFIGTDATGALSRGNGQASSRSGGVFVDGSSGNWIGGPYATNRNLISANGGSGIFMQNCRGNTVQGNFIGTALSGTAALGNTTNGISLYNAVGNLIGGVSAAARNVISGNGASGVYLYLAGTTGNLIQGNYIGTGANGTVALANASDGVTVMSAPGNTIGGVNPGEGNLVSGNGGGGVALNVAGADGNLVQGNLIGTDATGTLALGNKFSGITIFGGNSNLIGGATAAARNLVSGNKLAGVYLSTNSLGNLVQGNYIGVGIAGTNALGNAGSGISIDSASFNTIGGLSADARNLVSGNTQDGIVIFNAPATGNAIQGNYIGSDASGMAGLPNGGRGIQIQSPGNSVGGSAAGAGNLVSGNTKSGIYLYGLNAASNVVQGNFVGTTRDGAGALGNGLGGIYLQNAPANLIGGTTSGAGNLVSGNALGGSGLDGILLTGSGATRNLLQGNIIGPDITGNTALWNLNGIYLDGAWTNTIGGTAPGAGNLISGNFRSGIYLTNASWNVIQGNLIGTTINGLSPLGNSSHGIDCQKGSSNNTIGGSNAGAGNRIAYAGALSYSGVRIRDGSTNDAILGNAIFLNGSLGIDLGNATVNPNIPCGTNSGANLLQNYPVLAQAVGGNGTGIRGTLNSKTNRSYLIQFFANPFCGSAGYGQGQIYLGQKTVSTTNNCTVGFVANLPVQVPLGYAITSTATDSANNTSEFSACVALTSVPTLRVWPATNQWMSVAWTNTATGFVLKTSDSLSPPIHWTTATNAVVNINGQFVVTLSTVTSNRFYVLSFE